MTISDLIGDMLHKSVHLPPAILLFLLSYLNSITKNLHSMYVMQCYKCSHVKEHVSKVDTYWAGIRILVHIYNMDSAYIKRKTWLTSKPANHALNTLDRD